MQLRHLWRWLPGWARVEAEGGFPERLLNESAAAGIAVWSVRHRRESTRFSCMAGDYRRLRRPARRAGVRMRVVRKSGLPFLLRRYRHRKGLAVGLAIYGLLLALLAPRIWVIEVIGNTATDGEQIRAVAQQMGVEIGARTDRLQIKSLEIEGLRQLPTLAWITVNPSGSVARLEVTERSPTPQVLDLSQPSDIIALRDGRILSMTVLSGERTALVGEAVAAGTLLITGRQETELGERLFRAYGEVWAETRRQITVTVPLTYEETAADGCTVLRPTVTFLRWRIPLYTDRPLEEDAYIHWERAHFLRAGGLTLPLGVTNAYYVRVVRRPATRTPEEAARLAGQQLRSLTESVLADVRYTETDRRTEVTDTEYRLTVGYRCEENIAVEVPLGTADAAETSHAQQ